MKPSEGKKFDTFFLPVKASEKEVKRRCANGRTENILDQISAICLQGIMYKNKLGYTNMNITRKQHTVMFNFKAHHHSKYSLHTLTSFLVYKNLSLHTLSENYVTITNAYLRLC